jgi:hypothetical protein
MFEESGDSGILHMIVAAKNAQFTVFLYPDDDKRILTITIICPLKVPEHKRAAVLVLLNKINSVIQAGSYTLNESENEIQCSVQVLLGPSEADEVVFDRHLADAIQSMDAACPAIAAVCYGDTTPKEHAQDLKRTPSSKLGKNGYGQSGRRF